MFEMSKLMMCLQNIMLTNFMFKNVTETIIYCCRAYNKGLSLIPLPIEEESDTKG